MNLKSRLTYVQKCSAVNETFGPTHLTPQDAGNIIHKEERL